MQKNCKKNLDIYKFQIILSMLYTESIKMQLKYERDSLYLYVSIQDFLHFLKMLCFSCSKEFYPQDPVTPAITKWGRDPNGQLCVWLWDFSVLVWSWWAACFQWHQNIKIKQLQECSTFLSTNSANTKILKFIQFP